MAIDARAARAQPDTLPDPLSTSPLRARVRAALLDPSSPTYGLIIKLVVGLIFLSVFTIVIETVDEVYRPFELVIQGLEVLILAAFTAEFAANLYAAEDRGKYLTSFWGIVDLLAIVPGYLSLLHVAELKFIRTLRVLRVLRVLKLMKLAATRAEQSSVRAVERKNTFALDIQIYFIALFTVVVIASTLGYYAESDVPGTQFTSIPAAMWWAMVTITTTGYGDMVPVTLWGRLIAAGTMLSGLALFGILTSVIGRAVLTSLFGAPSSDTPHDAPPVQLAPLTPARQGAAFAAASADARASLPAVTISITPAPDTLASRGMVPAGHAVRTSGAVAARASAVISVAPAHGTASHGPVRRDSSAAYMRTSVQAREVREDANVVMRLIHAAFVDQSNRLFHIVSGVIVALVFLSVGLVIVESVDEIHARYAGLFSAVEYAVVIAFTIEYLAYFLVAKNKREYVLSFWGIVDLLAIVPSYLSLLNFTGVKVVRTLRILRVLRILKLSKVAAQRGQESARRRDSTFWIDLQIYVITLLTAVVLSSTLVYYAERDVPHTLYTDIPTAMWWAIVTITTTGYGDMAPLTLAGRVVAGVTMLTGLALFGILTSVIGRAMLSSLFGHTDDAE